MVSSTNINAIDLKTYRQNGLVEWTTGFRHKSLRWRGFESYYCQFVDILIRSIVSLILNTCTWYLLPSSILLTSKHTGRMVEWNELLVLGTSHFGGVGSSPTIVILLTFLKKVLFPLFWTPAHGVIYTHPCNWPQNIQAGWLSGIRSWFTALDTSMAWVRVPLLTFCRIAIQSIASFILNTCTWYLLPSSMQLTTQHTGRMAEWSKVLV